MYRVSVSRRRSGRSLDHKTDRGDHGGRAPEKTARGPPMDDLNEPDRHFELEPRGAVTVVRFVDNQLSPSAREPLFALPEDPERRKLLLDLQGIDTLSTHSLGILANFQRKLDALGGQLKFCNLSPDMKQLFRMTKFDQIFEIYDNPEHALGAF
jgi:anti-sigma B factor antagonist